MTNLETLEASILEAISNAQADAALGLAEQALADFPEQAQAYFLFGQTLDKFQPQRLEEMIWAYGRASNLDGANLDYLLYYAHKCLDFKDLQNAAGAYNYLREQNPEDYRPYIGLSNCALANGFKEDALAYLQQFEQPNAPILAQMAQIALDDFEFETASQQAKAALELQAQNAQALSILATLARFEDQMQQALSYAKQAVELEPNNPKYQAECASLLLALGQQSQALEHIEKALQQYARLPLHIQADTLSDAIEIAYENQAYAKVLEWYPLLKNLDKERAKTYRETVLLSLAAQNQAAKALKLLDKMRLEVQDDDMMLEEMLTYEFQIQLLAQDFAKAQAVVDKLAESVYYQNDMPYYKAQLLVTQNELEQAYDAVQAQANQPIVANFIQTKLATVVSQRAKATYAQYEAAAAENQQSSLLQALFGKIWTFQTGKFTPKTEAENELVQVFEAQASEVLPSSFMVFGPSTLLIVLPPIGEIAGLAHAFAYKIDKGKDNLALLNLQSLDGLHQVALKIKLDDKGLVVSWGDNLAFRLQASQESLEDLVMSLGISYSVDLGYLNLGQHLPASEAYLADMVRIFSEVERP